MPINDPTDISDLAMWLPRTAASRFTTIAGGTNVSSGGDNIGRWEDASGNSRHFVASADDGTRPTYDAADVGTIFNGTSQFLTRASFGLYAAGAATMMAAIKGNPGTRRFVLTECSSSDSDPHYCLLASGNTTAARVSMWARNDAGGLQANPVDLEATGFWDNTERVIGAVDTGSVCTAWIDGSEQTGTAVNYTRSGSLTFDRISMGARHVAVVGSFFACTVYEIVAYSRALNDTEAADLSDYLAGVVGGGLSIPIAYHHYRTMHS